MNQIARTVIRDFHTKVVGVTFGNPDGSSRQAYISNLKPNQDLVLRPVPTAQYPDAIGVFTLDGKQLGLINEELAAEIKYKYPMNFMQVTVSSITGGNGKNYGCNIHVIIYGEVSSPAPVQPFYQQPVNTAVQPKRKTWLWVLGWIFIFPLPLTLILLKDKSIKKAIKYGLIIAVWIVYILIIALSPRNNAVDSDLNNRVTSQVPTLASMPQNDSDLSVETDAPTETVPSEKKTDAPTERPTEVPTEPKTSIVFTSYTDYVEAGGMANVTIQGEPNTDYNISVFYSSTASHADGLEKKTSDDYGYVSWDWKVGTNTTKGEHYIVVSGGGTSERVYFTVG